MSARIEESLWRLVDQRREVGLQVAAYLDGELVVDAFAGVADPATGHAVDGDTLFYLFSCGKGVTATAVHLLVDRGVLDYDTPIAAYWPAFAAHGKDRVTVRHALTHAAGLPHLPPGTTLAEMCDWERMCEVVADLTPLWEPGTRSGYHAKVYGWLLGETVRRADGRGVDRVVREEIAEPLGVADALALGIDASMRPRMAWHVEVGEHGPEPGGEPADPDAPLEALPAVAQANHPARQLACLPHTCSGTARGLARMYAALACGGALDGVRLLREERLAEATAVAFDGPDALSGSQVRRALGYVLGEPDSPLGHRRAFGHVGWGESIGFADPRHRFAFALAKNGLTDDWSPASTPHVLAREVRAALGLPAARGRPGAGARA
ncbi:serine hydrolase domain-containing protein [Streptomyces sp. 4N509B]|uniref:serine hydrolase domain-containing protein n=1 Tax=Streptomyces sp. 4N509B TaxID=3457413 RepID=UPI003FD03FFB